MMIKPRKLKYGTRVAIVSPSKGMAGEDYAIHETLLGSKRLIELGLVPVFMKNSLRGNQFLNDNPKKKAEDFIDAVIDDTIGMILPTSSGTNSYLMMPYLCNSRIFLKKMRQYKKIFVGYGDSTLINLFLYKKCIVSFYGPNLLCDFAEFGNDMLIYTKDFFLNMFNTNEKTDILISKYWYKDRKDYSIDYINENRKPLREKHGYEILNGKGIVTGKLLGGNLESLYEAYVGDRFKEEKEILKKLKFLPNMDDWKNKILFFDTNEHSQQPSKIEKILNDLDSYINFKNLKGVIIAKPINEKYYNEYKELYKSFFKKVDVPVIYNVNFGHAYPRCFIPYGVKCKIDFDNKKITIVEKMFE